MIFGTTYACCRRFPPTSRPARPSRAAARHGAERRRRTARPHARRTSRPRHARPPRRATAQRGAAERLVRWRNAFPALDTLIRGGAPPAAAMRRLGLTFWAAG